MLSLAILKFVNKLSLRSGYFIIYVLFYNIGSVDLHFVSGETNHVDNCTNTRLYRSRSLCEFRQYVHSPAGAVKWSALGLCTGLIGAVSGPAGSEAIAACTARLTLC